MESEKKENSTFAHAIIKIESYKNEKDENAKLKKAYTWGIGAQAILAASLLFTKSPDLVPVVYGLEFVIGYIAKKFTNKVVDLSKRNKEIDQKLEEIFANTKIDMEKYDNPSVAENNRRIK